MTTAPSYPVVPQPWRPAFEVETAPTVAFLSFAAPARLSRASRRRQRHRRNCGAERRPPEAPGATGWRQHRHGRDRRSSALSIIWLRPMPTTFIVVAPGDAAARRW
jgi:hypothetical protein